MKKGRFLCYNMMKFHMINHLFDITEVIWEWIEASIAPRTTRLLGTI
jgi:hypothetical protein